MAGTPGIISAGELAGRLDDADLRLVDCRFDLADEQAGRRAYEAGHLPGAIYAHLHEDLAAPVTPATGRHPLPDPEAFAGILGDWGIHRDSTVVAYDDGNGAMAARLWWMLGWLGHEQVALLDGGYQGWLKFGGALRKGTERYPGARFQAQVRQDGILDRADVARGLSEGSLLLIDVRARDRYLGKTEPLDKVAGHIPGAINLPFQNNLDQAGYFLDPQALRAMYLDLARTHPGKQMPGASLYPGSWSEWITDTNLPVATGDEPA
jgi:thiosulfate/3-mercaptopyruvate sulfurtransferase